MTRILVTGGAGAIGSNLVRTLISEGHDVFVLDDLSSGRRSLLPENAEFIEGSVVNLKDLDRAFDHEPDLVVHMAALFANQNSVDHPVKDLEVNGKGTALVLESCVRANVRKVVNISSSCVYGTKELMTEEDRNFDPDTPYAFTKLLGERYCKFWAHENGLDTLSLRLFNSYGPNEYPGKYRNVIPNFISKAIAGEPLTITGTGEETRDFTFVSDTVSGITRALFAQTQPGDIFNIGSGQSTRIIDIAEMINKLAGNSAPIEFQPRRSWDHVLHRRGDISKAKRIIGYQPRVGIEDGLQAVFEWVRDFAS